MNYVKEISSFYSWLELHTLAPSSINLWYALMHINQKASWAETFSVAETVLSIKTSLTGRTLRKARKELTEKGRIEYISRKGKAAIYRVIPFEEWNQRSEPLQLEGLEESDCPSLEKSDAVYPEMCSKDNRSSEINSFVCVKERTEDCQTPEKISVIHSEDCTEEHSSSENISAICSTLFRQQQTDKQLSVIWSDLVSRRSAFGCCNVYKRKNLSKFVIIKLLKKYSPNFVCLKV